MNFISFLNTVVSPLRCDEFKLMGVRVRVMPWEYVVAVACPIWPLAAMFPAEFS